MKLRFIRPAGTKDDKRFADQDLQVSQHNSKPRVMRSPLSSEVVLFVSGVLEARQQPSFTKVGSCQCLCAFVNVGCF